MDTALFMVAFICALLALSDGFLILHARKEQCLLGNSEKVLVGTCNLTNPWQQWQWTDQGKLRLLQIDQCLALVSSTGWHFRTLALQDCAKAPRWKCYDNLPGRLGLADREVFLKKMGHLAVVKAETKYHDSWLKYELGENGEPRKLNMCPTQVAFQARSLNEDPPSFRSNKVKWDDDVARGVTEQLIEQTTYSSMFSSPRSEDPCSMMTCFYNQTEKVDYGSITRSQRFKIIGKRSREKMIIFSLSIVGICNAIPDKLVEADSINDFKRDLDRYLRMRNLWDYEQKAEVRN